jgi:Flp pilus assembly protein TadD
MQRSQGWKTFSAEENAEIVRLAQQAFENGKDDPDTLWMASYTLLAHGDNSAAASAIDRALALNPNSAHAWMASGMVSVFRQEPDLAIGAFHRAMRLSPYDPLGYRFTGGLAIANLVAGRFDQAVMWADRALREQPRYTAAIRMKVVSCACLRRTAEARESLGRLLELQPDFTVTSFRLYAERFVPAKLLLVYIEGLRKAGLPEE